MSTDKSITLKKAIIIGVTTSISSMLIGMMLSPLEWWIEIISAPFISAVCLIAAVIDLVGTKILHIDIGIMIEFILPVLIYALIGAIMGYLLWRFSIRSRELNIWRFVFRTCVILAILGFISFVLLRFVISPIYVGL